MSEEKFTKDDLLEGIIMAALEEPERFGSETVISLVESSGFGEMLQVAEAAIADETAIEMDEGEDPDPDDEEGE